MVKLHKVIGTVTHEITLPDNVAKQMLEKHPDLYKVVSVEPEETKAADIKVTTDESTVNADELAKAVTKRRGRRGA